MGRSMICYDFLMYRLNEYVNALRIFQVLLVGRVGFCEKRVY